MALHSSFASTSRMPPLLPPPTSDLPPPRPPGTYAQERPPTHKTAGWLRFLFWEGGTQWDAWLCCASAQVRGGKGGEMHRGRCMYWG